MEDFKACNIKIIDRSQENKLYFAPGWQEVQELIDKLNQCFNNEQEKM